MTQHEPSNNPNRFAIRDPCGGYWVRVQNIDMVVEAQAPVSYNLSQCLAAYHNPPPLNSAVSQLPVAMHIKEPFDNALYLSSLYSDLSM